MGTEKEDLRALKCVKCGGDISKSFRVEDEDEIPLARCVSCGTEYDQYTKEYYQYFADDFTHDRDSSVFRLGLKGTLEGVEYEIIGRLRYQDEDDCELSVWDEWLAISTEGVYHYFVEEEGEVWSYEEYVPSSIDLESDPVDFEGKRIDRDESYVGRIVYAEGELPWQPEIGEPATCWDIKKDGHHYSIEQSEDEVSITRGERISYEDIIKAFGDDRHKELYTATMLKRKSYRLKSRLYLVLFIAGLVMSIYSCMSEKPLDGVMSHKRIINSDVPIEEQGQKAFFSQVLYGPFIIPEKDRLYEFNLDVDEKVQPLHLEWQSFRVMLIREERLKELTKHLSNFIILRELLGDIDMQKDPLECFTASGDFWDEEGRDSDGYWHENDLTASSTFVMDEAGPYFVYLELYNQKPRNIDAVSIRLSMVSSYRYYLALAVISMFMMMFIKSRAGNYNELPFEVGKD